MTPEELQHLVEHLRSMPRETEWLEFKHNNADAQEIGEYLSALSNGAALHRQGHAYIVWGIEDGTHELVGTAFQPRRAKVGNEELENWLLRLLNPRIDFRIHEGEVAGRRVVLLEIQPASHQPVSFSGAEYVRIGTYKKKLREFPEKERALWALFANALIHQDFNISGTGPMIELFDGRMEITNPGLPLVDPLRFIDEPPRSRNETLAGLMRRMNFCEERGSGIKKVIAAVEEYQLPAPDFRTTPQHTIAALFGPRAFADMDRQERIRACYQHACGCYVSGREMTNASLRARLGLERERYVLITRLIRDTVDAGLIRLAGGSRKDANYVPFWA